VIAFYLGQWDQARLDFERAVAICRQIGASSTSAYPLFELGRLCLAEGRWDEASRYLEESIAIAGRSGDLQALCTAQSVLAERDLLAGHPDEARARLLPLIDAPGQEEKDLALLYPLLAWAHLELDDLTVAAEIVARSIPRVRAANNRLALVDALRVQAMVLTRQSRRDEATRVLDEALSLAQAMPYPFVQGRLLYVEGLLHAQGREDRQARERLQGALAIFRQLGAAPSARRVERTLAELPHVTWPWQASAAHAIHTARTEYEH
jgi:tetratricopeptide (TPR) repeat protein